MDRSMDRRVQILLNPESPKQQRHLTQKRRAAERLGNPLCGSA